MNLTIVGMKFNIVGTTTPPPIPASQHINTVFIARMDFSSHKYPKANFFLMVQNFRSVITQKHLFLFTCKCKQDSREKYTPPAPQPSEGTCGGAGCS